MTPEQIKAITPEQYGGDFELTVTADSRTNHTRSN